MRTGQLAKVVDAAEIYGEVGGNGQVVDVHAKFDVVLAFDPGEVIGPLVANLFPVYKRERLAPKE